MKTDLTEPTLFPKAEAIPKSLAIAFLRMMMEHARFELQVRLLQSSVAIGRIKQRRSSSNPDFGEQPRNQWKSRDRAKCMKKLIAKKLGEIPETKAIIKLLEDAIAPGDVRNRLAHGTWWSFDPRTVTIRVRGGIQRKGERQFAYYTEMCIRAIAEKFETLEAELYKLRSKSKIDAATTTLTNEVGVCRISSCSMQPCPTSRGWWPPWCKRVKPLTVAHGRTRKSPQAKNGGPMSWPILVRVGESGAPVTSRCSVLSIRSPTSRV